MLRWFPRLPNRKFSDPEYEFNYKLNHTPAELNCKEKCLHLGGFLLYINPLRNSDTVSPDFCHSFNRSVTIDSAFP